MRTHFNATLCWAAALLLACLAAPALAFRLPEEGTGPRVQVYTLWSRNYLCLGARVPDTMLTGSNTSPLSAPEQDDAIEFCLEVPGPKGPAAYRLAISAAGGMTVLKRDARGNWRADPSWVSGIRTVKFGVTDNGTLNKPDDEDNGFVVEAAIPWEFLTGGKAPQGQRIGFNVVVWMQGENQGIASWSPLVKTEDQVGDVSRWGSAVITYGSAAANATGWVVECPFAGFTPFIDGRLAAQEWLTAGTLSFHKPPPAVSPKPKSPRGSAQSTGEPGMILAVYRYDWEAPENSSGGTSLLTSDGRPATPDQPKEGCGPWYSYRRVAWHRSQLEAMSGAGVDILLARYRGDEQARRTWARTGLDLLTQALKELRAEGKPYPLVGMMLDTEGLAGVDLTTEAGRKLVYGMIRDFFLHVPPEFRAQLGLAAGGERPPGVPVLLGEPDSLADWNTDFLSYCDQRFAEDFSSHLAWLGSAAWRKKGKPDFYAFVRLAGKSGLTQEAVGGAAAMSISPGYCITGPNGEMRSRRDGRSYRTDWQRVLAGRPELVVINSWDDFSTGTEIAPTRQYGYTYTDMTEMFGARLGSDLPHYLWLKQVSLPAVMKPGAKYLVEMLIENAGTEEVRTGRRLTVDYSIARRSDGEVVQHKIAAQALRLPAGFTRLVPVEVAAVNRKGDPLPPGDYLFSLVVMKSRVAYLRSKWFARSLAKLTVPITVGEPPPRAATVISTSLPSAMESGAIEKVIVRLRNDGAKPWHVGEVKLSYHWLRYKDDLQADSLPREVVCQEGARVDLPHEVKPGEVVSVMIPVSALAEDGTALPPSDPAGLWHYRIQWDLVSGDGEWFSRLGGIRSEEAIEVVKRDVGAVIEKAAAPSSVTAGQSFEAQVTVGNAGPHTWVAGDAGSPDYTLLVCQWYYWDGQPCQGLSTRTPLPRDVAPGDKITVKAAVTAPPAAGPYWLAWRVEQPAVPAPAVRWRDDLLVEPIQVSGGVFQPVDLSSAANIVAVTEDSYRTRGDLDGQGRTFPAESLPPDLSGAEGDIYPSGYYAAPAGDRVPFSFPDTRGGVAGAVACEGQKITLGDAPARAIYLLAASTQGERHVGIRLLSPAGEEEVCTVTVPDWTSPREGDEIGAYTPYLRGLTRDDVFTQGHLYLLKLRPTGFQSVSAVQLPEDPAVKVIAITVERD